MRASSIHRSYRPQGFMRRRDEWGKLSHYGFFIQASGGAVRVHIVGASMECIAMGLPSALSIDSIDALRRALAMPQLAIDYYGADDSLMIFKSTDDFRAFLCMGDRLPD